jgi:hypothetical protein
MNYQNDLDKIHEQALELVLAERRHQVVDLNYTAAHDDKHGHGQLAIAGAQMLLPQEMNEDIVHHDTDFNLVVSQLFGYLEAESFDVGRKHEGFIESPVSNGLDVRIENVKTGVALGLAELERLLRLKAAAQ